MIRSKLAINTVLTYHLFNSEVEWTKLITDFLNNSKDFANKVEAIEDTIFDQTFIDEKYGTFLRNIEGVIEHSYYHLGQISLLRKIICKNF